VSVQQHPTVVHLIEHAVSTFPDSPAYTCLGHTLSFKQIEERSLQFASYLQNHTSLKPGDRVALQLPNVSQYPSCKTVALKRWWFWPMLRIPLRKL